MSDLLERLRAALTDRYAVESEIGRGGMAVVFLAEDLKHHRKVAVKVLHPELTATLGAERFLREIEIAARLDHPHIVDLPPRTVPQVKLVWPQLRCPPKLIH